MNVTEILLLHTKLELSERFDERHSLNITNRSSQLRKQKPTPYEFKQNQTIRSLHALPAENLCDHKKVNEICTQNTSAQSLPITKAFHVI